MYDYPSVIKRLSERTNTKTFKASQYDHKIDKYIKKRLNDRWHHFSDGSKVQRDLYSAFLLMNATVDGQCADRNKCKETFDQFKELHDIEIHRLEQLDTIVLNSGIRLKNKKLVVIA